MKILLSSMMCIHHRIIRNMTLFGSLYLKGCFSEKKAYRNPKYARACCKLAYVYFEFAPTFTKKI